MNKNLPFLIFNKGEWLFDSQFKWTEKEIDEAIDNFIGTKFGVNCYVSRPIKAISIPPPS